MSQNNFSMTTSMHFNQPYNNNFQYNKLQQSCKRLGIRLSKFSDTQLEATYCMQGFKATGQKANEVCYIFISLYDTSVLPIFSYYNGTLIQKKDLNNEAQIPDFIAASLRSVGQNFPQSKSIEDQYKQLQRLYENLHKKSEQILKSQNNQMMAIQKLKTSQEYMAVCNYAKRVSQQLSQICQMEKKKQSQSKIKNQQLLNQMLQIQQSKQRLQQSLFKYTQLMKKANDVDGILSRFITEKKQRANQNDFNDESSFSRYLQQSISLKRLQNQKKFLGNK